MCWGQFLQVFATWAIGIDLFSPPPRTFFVSSAFQFRKKIFKSLVTILKEVWNDCIHFGEEVVGSGGRCYLKKERNIEKRST